MLIQVYTYINIIKNYINYTLILIKVSLNFVKKKKLIFEFLVSAYTDATLYSSLYSPLPYSIHVLAVILSYFTYYRSHRKQKLFHVSQRERCWRQLPKEIFNFHRRVCKLVCRLNSCYTISIPSLRKNRMTVEREGNEQRRTKETKATRQTF